MAGKKISVASHPQPKFGLIAKAVLFEQVTPAARVNLEVHG
jgi:hypothetical protein